MKADKEINAVVTEDKQSDIHDQIYTNVKRTGYGGDGEGLASGTVLLLTYKTNKLTATLCLPWCRASGVWGRDDTLEGWPPRAAPPPSPQVGASVSVWPGWLCLPRGRKQTQGLSSSWRLIK